MDKRDVASVQTAISFWELGVCSPAFAESSKQGLYITYQIKTETPDLANFGGLFENWTSTTALMWLWTGYIPMKF